MKFVYAIIIALFISGCSESPPPYKLIYSPITKKAQVLKIHYRDLDAMFPKYSCVLFRTEEDDRITCLIGLEDAKKYYKKCMDDYEKFKTIKNSWIEIDREEVEAFSGSLHKKWDSYKKHEG